MLTLGYDRSNELFHRWGNPLFKSAYKEPLFESLLPSSELNKHIVQPPQSRQFERSDSHQRNSMYN